MEEKRLKEDLIKATRTVKKKFQDLRKNIHLEEELNRRRIEPILKPLTTLIDLTQEKAKEIKTAAVKEEEEDSVAGPSGESRGKWKKERRKRAAVSSSTSEDEDPVYETIYQSREDEERDNRLWEEYCKTIGPLSRKYLEGLLQDNPREGKYDTTFGIRIDSMTNAWKIGNKTVEFDRTDTIHIGNEIFPGSRGLFELIFKRRPDRKVFNSDHEKQYKEILQLTSAHKQRYDPNGKIASSGGSKYTQVIGRLFHTKGRGILPVTDNKIDYIRWDDPNELVERLALLRASEEAGNRGHEAEIASIEEELREGRYIR